MENKEMEFFDFEPRTSSVLKEVLSGLSQGQKTLSPKFFYDKKGSEIFEEICLLDEYYPTRAEEEILSSHSREISRFIGEGAVVIETRKWKWRKVSSTSTSLVKTSRLRAGRNLKRNSPSHDRRAS